MNGYFFISISFYQAVRQDGRKIGLDGWKHVKKVFKMRSRGFWGEFLEMLDATLTNQVNNEYQVR